jgi:purine nucleosidase/pyrimidine-specific ribonucleoside hydrolase
MQKLPLILDTDIGDDVDDALALALILRSPELDLRGITTVFADTKARTRQARTLLKLAGRTDVPVADGVQGTCRWTARNLRSGQGRRSRRLLP